MTAEPRILRDVLVPAVVAGGALSATSGLLRGDLVIVGDRVADVRPAPETATPRLVIPAPVEAHCHLDKCHSLHRLGDVGGDLAAALVAQRADKGNWTETDLRHRAERGLAELTGAGCRLARTHVDWGDTAEPPLAWHVLADLAHERALDITLDRAALTGVDQLADPDIAVTIAGHVARANGTLGVFVLNHPGRKECVYNALAAADRFGLALDFHVDEDLDGTLDGLEIIADATLEHGFQGPVLCGHACALMSKTGAGLDRVIDKVARAGLFVASLPTTNLYLQGRRPGTPDRRGLTRLRELRAAGVPIVIGSDNVVDAFCPVGQHDPVAALHLAIMAGHLDPPLERWLPTITTDAARALGRDPVSVIGARAADLVISAATSVAELITGRCGPLYSLNAFSETPDP